MSNTIHTKGSGCVQNTPAESTHGKEKHKPVPSDSNEMLYEKGKHVFCSGVWFRLVSSKHKDYAPVDTYNCEKKPVTYARLTCIFQLESLPPGKKHCFERSDVWRGKYQMLPSGEYVKPTWHPPFEIHPDFVIDTEGFWWEIEVRDAEIVENDAETKRRLYKAVSGEEEYPDTAKLMANRAEPLATVSLQPDGKPLSAKLKAARRKGGKLRAVIDTKDEAPILAKYANYPNNTSKTFRAFHTSKWCEATGLLRKDGESITPRNIIALVNRKTKKSSVH